MSFAAITTVPKTTHNIPHLTRAKNRQHKSPHGAFLDSLTVNLFKIPDVKQRLKRRHTTPPSTQFFINSFAWSEINMNFNPKTYFEAKYLLLQQQSSQYPNFPSQARDQSFTRVAQRTKLRWKKNMEII